MTFIMGHLALVAALWKYSDGNRLPTWLDRGCGRCDIDRAKFQISNLRIGGQRFPPRPPRPCT